MGQPPRLHLAFQGFGDVPLSHHIIKGAGAPLAVQGLIQFHHLEKKENFGEKQGRTPAFEARGMPVTWTAGSRTVTPRHTQLTA